MKGPVGRHLGLLHDLQAAALIPYDPHHGPGARRVGTGQLPAHLTQHSLSVQPYLAARRQFQSLSPGLSPAHDNILRAPGSGPQQAFCIIRRQGDIERDAGAQPRRTVG